MCPVCDGDRFHYDESKDMYNCLSCFGEWYPNEIGRNPNPIAPRNTNT